MKRLGTFAADVAAVAGSGGGGSSTPLTQADIVGILSSQANYRYWRVLVHQTSDIVTIAELVMATSPGGPTACIGGVASANAYLNNLDGFKPANAFDGDRGTLWGAQTAAPPDAYIQYDFGVKVSIAEIRMTARSDGAPGQNPQTFEVLGSNDNATFTRVGQPYAAATWSAGQTQIFAVGAGAVNPFAATPVSHTYTASGAIVVSDTLAVVNTATTAVMTLAAGTIDGQNIVIKRLGVGVLKVSAVIDGTDQTMAATSTGLVKESLSLTWSGATWLARAESGMFSSVPNTLPSARYWRLRITANTPDDYTQIGKLTFLDSSGTNLATDSTKFAVSTAYQGFNLTDGINDWASSSPAKPQTVQYDFTTPVQIGSVGIYAGNTDNNFRRAPSTFFIEYSTDGTNWIQLVNPTPAPWTVLKQLQTFSTY